jgi:hypothetical protein
MKKKRSHFLDPFWDLGFAKPRTFAWLDGVSPYQHTHDDSLVGRRSAEPDLFGIWVLGFGALMIGILDF